MVPQTNKYYTIENSGYEKVASFGNGKCACELLSFVFNVTIPNVRLSQKYFHRDIFFVSVVKRTFHPIDLSHYLLFNIQRLTIFGQCYKVGILDIILIQTFVFVTAKLKH